jgi:hypothetical protein
MQMSALSILNAIRERPPSAGQFADKSMAPVEAAYQLAVLMERSGAKEVVLKAAQNLLAKGESGQVQTGKHPHSLCDRRCGWPSNRHRATRPR